MEMYHTDSFFPLYIDKSLLLSRLYMDGEYTEPPQNVFQYGGENEVRKDCCSLLWQTSPAPATAFYHRKDSAGAGHSPTTKPGKYVRLS